MRNSEALIKRKRPGKPRKEKKALLAAPVTTDTSLIRQLLSAEGVSAFTVDELALPGQSLQGIVEKAVRRADVVIVVLPAEVSRENVLIELGFALACRKPILLITDAAAALPAFASSIPYLRADLGNAEALRFGLTQFLAAPPLKRNAAPPASKQSQPIGAHADDLLARLRRLPERRGEQDLEQLIAEAIRMSGIPTLAERGRLEDAEIAIAVWSDDLEPWMNNPLPIEVKGKLRGQGDLDDITGRFRR